MFETDFFIYKENIRSLNIKYCISYSMVHTVWTIIYGAMAVFTLTHPYIFSNTCGQGYRTITQPSLWSVFPIRVKNKAWIMPCLHEINCYCIVHVDFRNIVHGGNMNIDSNSNGLMEVYFRNGF